MEYQQADFFKQFYSTCLIILSSVLYGFLGFLGIKLLYDEHFTMSAMLFWRFFIAALWMLAIMLLKNKSLIFTVTKQRLFIILVLGSICYSGTSALYFLASERTGTGLAMVIFFAYPLFVGVIGWIIHKQTLSKPVIAALFAIVIGLICLKGKHQDTLSILGIFLAVTSALFYALYIFLSKRISHTIDSDLLTAIICVGSAVLFIMIALGTDSFVFPTSKASWVYILALGIIATALPIQLFFQGLKHISPCKASILSVLEPAVTLLIGFFYLQEAVSSLQFLGVLIILGSTILVQFDR